MTTPRLPIAPPTANLDPAKPQSQLRVQLGTALQKHRRRRGLTQAQLAEFADLSLKYTGEIERGEANTTLDAIERLAEAMGWDPMNALDGAREPITEGIRLLLVAEVQQIVERFTTMVKWLQALDPAKHPLARLTPSAVALLAVECPLASVADLRASRTDDLDKARSLLEASPVWRGFDGKTGTPLDVETSLRRYFERACEELWPYMDLVEAIGDRLLESRRLSARTVAALCREYER